MGNSNKIILGLVLFLGGCASTTVVGDTTLIECVERSQICTQQYDPVCGMGHTGDWQTYANGCTACSHLHVVGYRAGACE